MRLAWGLFAGAAVAAAAAVVLGDYPLTGAVVWTAAVLIPGLVALAAGWVAGGWRRPAVWLACAALSGGSMAWGFRIATGWGLDPTPLFAWAALALAVVWPAAAGFTAAAAPRQPGGPAPVSAAAQPTPAAAQRATSPPTDSPPTTQPASPAGLIPETPGPGTERAVNERPAQRP
ncbi:MAG TPA: hypothetical protein VKU88_12105 [Acidimicrobiales bacterium]|nr:hypothetical protein [Acidimicrobiales bacterium]